MGIERTKVSAFLKDQIKSYVAGDIPELVDSTPLIDLEIDSADMMSIIYDAEDAFGFELTESVQDEAKTIGDLIDQIVADANQQRT